MSNYRKGARLENKCREYLEKMGYYVMRSAGSKGPADLCAISGTDVLVIQVKSEGEATDEAILKLLQLVPKNGNITRQIWEWKEKKWNVYWSD